MSSFKICFLLVFCFYSVGHSQKTRTNSEIFEGVKKLKVLATVLYIAAHPDDENTRLITYLSKEKKFNTAYLSLTRGDGGQNLIGPELDELLGVIRTNELLEARKIDNGVQYFSRANDFGYSKTAEETFTFWNRDSILLDVIRLIREIKPDIIINRFDHRSSGKTHGHHTASAILGLEGYRHSNSPLFMPDALKGTEMHIVQRIFFNTSWFFFGGKEKFDAMDKSHLYQLDVGSFYPEYGWSNNEIASQSRSMHKSQGFGINSSRGSMMEYFEILEQQKDPNHISPFDGLDFSWTRINGGGNIDKLIDALILSFNFTEPWKNIPQLQKIEEYINDLADGQWKKIKLAEVRNLILDCSGFFAESFTDQFVSTPGNQLKITTECIIRHPINAQLESISIPICNKDSLFQIPFKTNNSVFWNCTIQLPENLESTTPFWLWNGRKRGIYQVDALRNFNLPVLNRTLKSLINIRILDKTYQVEREIRYKNDDPVLGEVKQNLDIIPGVTIRSNDNLYLTKEGKALIKINLQANADQQNGFISLGLPTEVLSNTNQLAFNLKKAGDQQELIFELKCSNPLNQLFEIPILINNQKAFEYHSVRYPHIPWQNILLPAQVKLIHSNVLINKKKRIAYLEGAGDYTDEALLKMNYKVTKISAGSLAALTIKHFDVLVFGIRSFNIHLELQSCKTYLERFMKEGGKVIIQYNTTAELVTTDFAPDSLLISRDRVTDETSPVTILKPKHPILNNPNKIGPSDFEHWVQERGLYFPNKYDKTYDEILSMNDPGEKDLKSGILVKQIGKGWFVYTPLAWFRQLKSGNPGSYRLFSNLISF